MQIAQIGAWEFEMPEGWLHTQSENSNSYFENALGTKGMYVKSIALEQPEESPSELASYIQSAHLEGFIEGGDRSWVVVDRRTSIEGELARSALDIYDSAAEYRVLSLVLATKNEAIQISIHDYLCEDYQVVRSDFDTLELSIARVPSAA